MFRIYRKIIKGANIHSLGVITDKKLFDFLIYISTEKISTFTITNGKLSDAGITILLEFLEDQHSLKSLKIYNNIMEIVSNNQEIPYLLTGTQQLAKTLCFKNKLEVLELHGFFFHDEDLMQLIKSLGTCVNLRVLQLSNNNIQDYGAELLAKMLVNMENKI